MPFDLNPWGFVRPAIHGNVVIFKCISKKSLTSSLPELGLLFLFQGKKREWKSENRRPWLALRSLLRHGRYCSLGEPCSLDGRDSWGLRGQSGPSLPGTIGWALGISFLPASGEPAGPSPTRRPLPVVGPSAAGSTALSPGPAEGGQGPTM